MTAGEWARVLKDERKARAVKGTFNCLLALAMLTPSVSMAEAQAVELEGSAGYYVYGGDIGGEGSFGLETVGSYAGASGFALGVGAGLDFRNLERDPIVGDIESESRLLQIFAQPSFRFDFTGRGMPHVRPFAGARIGYARLRLEVGDPPTRGIERSRGGVTVGGLGGAEVWITGRFGVTGSLLFSAFSFGDLNVNGEIQTGTDSSATRLGFRAGLKIRLR